MTSTWASELSTRAVPDGRYDVMSTVVVRDSVRPVTSKTSDGIVILVTGFSVAASPLMRTASSDASISVTT